MQPITITKNNFETEVKKSEKPVLLDFWAPWCGPCKAIAPILDEIAKEIENVKVGKINVDEEPELAASFGVMGIPFLAVIKDGEIVNKHVGAIPKEQIIKLFE